MVGGFFLAEIRGLYAYKLSSGNARESNPPTQLVTRHNGFEVGTRLSDSESLISSHLMPSSLKEFVTIFRAQSSTESGRSLFAYLLLMRQPLVGQATRDCKYPW